MGSMVNPNMTPKNFFSDCSQPICTTNCPQWCYIIFPPPPPSSSSDDGATNFSPLVVAVIGILTGAFLLITYYTIITKYCKQSRRRITANDPDSIQQNQNPGQVFNSGLDDSIIKSIRVYKYISGDGFIEGTECAVCLSDFEDNENLRVLPKCNHAFHLPCIDIWLKSHSNCPICRGNVVSGMNPVVELDQNERNSTGSISGNDLILVLDERERVVERSIENYRDGIRRSVSMGSLISFRGQIFDSEILFINGDDEEMGMGIQDGERENRSIDNGGESAVAAVAAAVIGRSVSTGRFMLSRYQKRPLV